DNIAVHDEDRRRSALIQQHASLRIERHADVTCKFFRLGVTAIPMPNVRNPASVHFARAQNAQFQNRAKLRQRSPMIDLTMSEPTVALQGIAELGSIALEPGRHGQALEHLPLLSSRG